MIIALTGATGFVGRCYAALAIGAGHRVRALVRGSSDKLSELIGTGRLDVVKGDLVGDPAAVERLLGGADAFVHLASAGVQAEERGWASMEATNVAAPLRWIEGAKRLGVGRVVYAGTCREYRGFGRLPDAPWAGHDPAPLCDEENASIESADGYGASKAAGGLVVRAFAREAGVSLWYLRFASLIGPGDDRRKLLPSALKAMRDGVTWPTTSGEQVRDWLHVDDAARAIDLAVARDPRGVRVVNVGTGVGVRQRDLLDRLAALAEESGLLAGYGERAYRAGEPHHLVLDSACAVVELDFRARVTVDDAISDVIRRTS